MYPRSVRANSEATSRYPSSRTWTSSLTATLVVAMLLPACSSGASPEATATSSTRVSTTRTSTIPEDPDDSRAGLAQLDCGLLLTQEEHDEATGVWDREGNQGSFMHSKGEVCRETLDADENVFIQISPGDPDDFEAGAELEGMLGTPAEGVGDIARWFGGPTAGTLSVSEQTSNGYLYYRIGLGRPDLDDEARLELARTLAQAALPRFPGVELEPAEPEIVTFDTEPVDLSVVGYAENLLVKEAAGEWTREQGLVETLKLFAGEGDGSGVLRHADLIDYSGTDVVSLAREYLETGTDENARAEIARLIGVLFPSPDQLEQMSQGGSDAEAGRTPATVRVVLAQESPHPCQVYYGVDPPCLLFDTSAELEERWPGRYRVWYPVSEDLGGWDDDTVDATIEALRKSIVEFSELAPPTATAEIVLRDGPEQSTTTTFFDDESCRIYVYPLMQEYGEEPYQQVLARDLALCFIHDAYPMGPGQWDPTKSKWWVPGLATYLSGWVYPEVNLEHHNLPTRLAAWELPTSLFERYFTNWVFFEYLHSIVDTTGILSLTATVEEAGAAVLAEHWHPFNEQLTDTVVPDIGSNPALVPYEPPFQDIEISLPISMTPHPSAFEMARAQMTVEGGKKACVTYDNTGGAVTSWREGAPGSGGGAWSRDLPSELSDVSVFLVTATEDGHELSMVVEKVVDHDEDCEEDLDESIDPWEPCGVDLCDPTAFYREDAP